MSKVVVGVDNSERALLECAQLARRHYDEVEGRAKRFGFNLDLESFKALAGAGVLRNVVARRGDEVVGYYTVIVGKCFQTSVLTANEVGIYLKPGERGTRTFYRLLKKVEEVAREEGCQIVTMGFKSGHDDGLAERLGYSKSETIYEKFIGE